ncbi:MAG: FAD-binding domain-containing protein [Bauldia sp.]|nr:FAD-binding domain-containing protein [Bauldia sp.]
MVRQPRRDDRLVQASPVDLAAAGVALGTDYPRPIVDHAAARRRALEAFEHMRATSRILPKSRSGERFFPR